MDVPELEALLVRLFNERDHPEIEEARSCMTPETAPAQPARVRLQFASGAEGTVLVHHVARRGRESRPWVLPKAVL